MENYHSLEHNATNRGKQPKNVLFAYLWKIRTFHTRDATNTADVDLDTMDGSGKNMTSNSHSLPLRHRGIENTQRSVGTDTLVPLSNSKNEGVPTTTEIMGKWTHRSLIFVGIIFTLALFAFVCMCTWAFWHDITKSPVLFISILISVGVFTHSIIYTVQCMRRRNRRDGVWHLSVLFYPTFYLFVMSVQFFLVTISLLMESQDIDLREVFKNLNKTQRVQIATIVVIFAIVLLTSIITTRIHYMHSYGYQVIEITHRSRVDKQNQLGEHSIKEYVRTHHSVERQVPHGEDYLYHEYDQSRHSDYRQNNLITSQSPNVMRQSQHVPTANEPELYTESTPSMYPTAPTIY